jgi:hypothetical protein
MWVQQSAASPKRCLSRVDILGALGRTVLISKFDEYYRLRYIEEITDYHPGYLQIHAPELLSKLQPRDTSWEEMVPPEVAQIIKGRGFFGYHSPAAAWQSRTPCRT